MDRARALLADASRIVAFTGAGISAESGIPTFRGKDGLWNDVEVETFGTPWGIRALLDNDPGRLASHLLDRADVLLDAQPNAAHKAIADLEQAGRLAGVVTQNVDGLHRDAGSRNIFCLHGDLINWRCVDCRQLHQHSRPGLKQLVQSFTGATTANEILSQIPHCQVCGGLTRPGVVLFGEELPTDQVEGAVDLLARCDLLLVIGTSGVVEPAASFARTVVRRGAPMIELNMEPGDLTSSATVSLFGAAGNILPELIA